MFGMFQWFKRDKSEPQEPEEITYRIVPRRQGPMNWMKWCLDKKVNDGRWREIVSSLCEGMAEDELRDEIYAQGLEFNDKGIPTTERPEDNRNIEFYYAGGKTSKAFKRGVMGAHISLNTTTIAATTVLM